MALQNIMWMTAAGFLLVGCVPTIPKELVNARTAYGQLATGPAKDLAPGEVKEARQALDRAEYAYDTSGASAKTRDLAAEAERKADMAQAQCALVASYMTMPKTITKTEVVTNTVTLKEQKVVSLPSNVLFGFDQSTLLPGAEKHLRAAAEALRAAKGEQNDLAVIIEGHTDSIGTAEYNKKLSERRAAAVRDYLVAHGQDASFVSLRAMGEEEPFTTNKTQEGRANNRRVEILIRNQSK